MSASNQSPDQPPLAEGFELSRRDHFWVDFQQRIPELELTVCTRAASAVLTVASISLSAQVALTPRKLWSAPFGAVVVFDLLTVAAALSVLMPTTWKLYRDHPDLIRAAYTAMVQKKRRRVWIALWLLALALAAWLVTAAFLPA